MEDVNQGVETNAAPPSGAEGQVEAGHNLQEVQAEPAPSEETLNTQDKSQPSEYVPYDRFKEVNDKNKTYAEQINALEEKAKLYDTFNNLVSSDEELYKKMHEHISAKQASQGQNPQAPQAQNYSQQPTYQPDPSVQSLVVDQYLTNFENFVKENNITPDQRAYIQQIAEVNLAKRNPYYMQRYDRGALQAALEDTKQFLDGFKKSTQASYVQQKTKNTPPVSSTGKQTGLSQKESGPRDQHTRANYLAQRLKAGTTLPAS